MLDAALALVATQDAASITLRGVARRAGVSPGAPYHHFKDKAALLGAVAQEGFEALAEAQRGCTDPDPARRLADMAATYVRFSVEHRSHYDVMFENAPGALDLDVREGLRQTAIGTFSTLAEAIHAVQPSLAQEQVQRRAMMAWALAHGAVEISQWASDLDPAFSVDALAQDVGEQTVQMAKR